MKRITRFGKRTWVLLGVVAVIAAFSAVGAYAYFTATGEGEGSASVGMATDWDVTTDPAAGGPLYPGFGSQTIDYTVENVGDGNQYLAQVAISVANNDGSAWSDGTCNKDDFSINGEAAGGTATDLYGSTLAPNDDVNDTITIAMVESGDNQDDCQGVTVPLYLLAS
jgi:hypothetical protein